MTDKEICFAWYKMERRDQQYWEQAFDIDNTSRDGYPVYSEIDDYTQEQLLALHTIDQRRFHLAKRRVKQAAQPTVITPAVQALELTAGEMPVKGLSPSTFVKALVVDKPVVIPKGLALTSVYTAARNKGIMITIRRKGDDSVIQRHS